MVTHLREAVSTADLCAVFVTVSTLVLMLGGCPPVLSDSSNQTDPDPNDNSQTDLVTLNQDDSGKSVALPLGGQLVIPLRTNRSLGNTWVLADWNAAVLEERWFSYETDCHGMDGCGGAETWIFVAEGTGETTVRFELRRIGADGGIIEIDEDGRMLFEIAEDREPLAVFEVTVTVSE